MYHLQIESKGQVGYTTGKAASSKTIHPSNRRKMSLEPTSTTTTATTSTSESETETEYQESEDSEEQSTSKCKKFNEREGTHYSIFVDSFLTHGRTIGLLTKFTMQLIIRSYVAAGRFTRKR